MLSRILTIILFISLMLPQAASAGETAWDGPFPQLVAHELDGKAVDLQKMHGKVVIVHFWATWCPTCREEMTMLNSFYRANHAKGVDMIALSLDQPNMRKKAQAVMKQFAYGAAMQEDVTNSDFVTPHGLPVTYIIDKHGRIAYTFNQDEKLSKEKLAGVVGPLLKQ